MITSKKGQEELIEQIIKIELDMFLDVPTTPDASACQENLKTFKLMRWMTHSVLQEEILLSYLEDLKRARVNGRNLMTEKYLRMEDKMPRTKESALIKKIIDIETNWVIELAKNYPLTLGGGGMGFKNYLCAELKTYSKRTLELYYKALTEAQREGLNLAERRYDNLFRKLGYSSIKGREEAAQSTR